MSTPSTDELNEKITEALTVVSKNVYGIYSPCSFNISNIEHVRIEIKYQCTAHYNLEWKTNIVLGSKVSTYPENVVEEKLNQRRLEILNHPEKLRPILQEKISAHPNLYRWSATVALYRDNFTLHSKEVCLPCEGEGKLTCKGCSGGGAVSCNNCGGHGVHNCSYCGGHATVMELMTCRSCGGSGRSGNHGCNGCGSSGSSLYPMQCRYCYGGKVRCNTCSGHGKLTCATCKGLKKVTCITCKGHCEIIHEHWLAVSAKLKSVYYMTKNYPSWMDEIFSTVKHDRELCSHAFVIQEELPEKKTEVFEASGHLFGCKADIELYGIRSTCIFTGQNNLKPVKLNGALRGCFLPSLEGVKDPKSIISVYFAIRSALAKNLIVESTKLKPSEFSSVKNGFVTENEARTFVDGYNKCLRHIMDEQYKFRPSRIAKLGKSSLISLLIMYSMLLLMAIQNLISKDYSIIWLGIILSSMNQFIFPAWHTKEKENEILIPLTVFFIGPIFTYCFVELLPGLHNAPSLSIQYTTGNLGNIATFLIDIAVILGVSVALTCLQFRIVGKRWGEQMMEMLRVR